MDTEIRIVLGIDPGTEQSGWVEYRPGRAGESVAAHLIEPNAGLLARIRGGFFVSGTACVVEDFENFGMPVGKSSIETIKHIGRITEAWYATYGTEPTLIPRRTVRKIICNSGRAKDPNVRMGLLLRFGGDRETAIGTQKHPGPLHGINAHEWSALALAVTYCEQHALLESVA